MKLKVIFMGLLILLILSTINQSNGSWKKLDVNTAPNDKEITYLEDSLKFTYNLHSPSGYADKNHRNTFILRKYSRDTSITWVEHWTDHYNMYFGSFPKWQDNVDFTIDLMAYTNFKTFDFDPDSMFVYEDNKGLYYSFVLHAYFTAHSFTCPCYTDLNSETEDVFTNIKVYKDDPNDSNGGIGGLSIPGFEFIIFGYGMGAMVLLLALAKRYRKLMHE